MSRLALIAAIASLVLSATGAAGSALPYSKQDVTLTMDDGVQIDGTLYTPTDRGPACCPAIVVFHGLGGSHLDSNLIAEPSFANEGYVVLTVDARGHGTSGGLVSVDGPREIKDVEQEYAWLAARPEVGPSGNIGSWGISYGGGAVWLSALAGVPWKAIEIVSSWTDLNRALVPNGLAKSGVILGFASEVGANRLTPETASLLQDALRGADRTAVAAFLAARSPRARLAGMRIPTFLLQGRRDFAFDLEQVTSVWNLLAGPKRLYIGDFGHAPSAFPGPGLPTCWANRRAGSRTISKAVNPTRSTSSRRSSSPRSP